MARYFLPRHGRTHCPGGSDPIPCLERPFGEAYKNTSQEIISSSFTKLTGFDTWNVPTPDIIIDNTEGLSLEVGGLYYLHAFVSWELGSFQDTIHSPGGFFDSWWCSLEWGFANGYTDFIHSDVQQVDGNFTTQSLDTTISGVAVIEAGTSIKLWVEQASGPTSLSNEFVSGAYMRAVLLNNGAVSLFA